MGERRWQHCQLESEPHEWCVHSELFGCGGRVTVWQPGGATMRGAVSVIGRTAGDLFCSAPIGAQFQARVQSVRTITGHDGAEVLLIVTDRIKPIGW